MKLFPATLAVMMLAVTLSVCAVAMPTAAQSSTIPDWQTAAGGKMQFEVASVKQNKSGGDNRSASSNMFGLNASPTFVPTGGRFTATNWPLLNYIMFAYKLSNPQLLYEMSGLPAWAGITGERFDVEARAQGNPTKDQYRLMVQALLVDGFKLTMHHEIREAPGLVMVLSKNGTTGPQLQQHLQNEPCSNEPTPGHGLPRPSGAQAPVAPSAPSQTSSLQLELIPCGIVVVLKPSTAGRIRMGAKNVTTVQIGESLGGDDLIDRPVIDGTGLDGTFDFSLEWSQHVTFAGPEPPDFNPDPDGPSLAKALQQQLGLKLESRKAPVDFIVIDHVEQPSPN